MWVWPGCRCLATEHPAGEPQWPDDTAAEHEHPAAEKVPRVISKDHTPSNSLHSSHHQGVFGSGSKEEGVSGNEGKECEWWRGEEGEEEPQELSSLSTEEGKMTMQEKKMVLV